MNTLADWHGGGPGPWILFFPVLWFLVIVGIVLLVRRFGRFGRAGHGCGSPYGAHGEHAPLAVLGRRYASGEIDEDEYRRRLSVLDEDFGRRAKKSGEAG